MKSPEFSWPVRVYYEDTDAGGVVYHARYLNLLERARTEWLRSLGVEQDHLLAETGLLFLVSRIAVDYLRPARFNQQLQVTVRAAVLQRGPRCRCVQEVRDLAGRGPLPRRGHRGLCPRARIEARPSAPFSD